MVATDFGAKTELDENNTFQVDKELTLLKSAAVYGANASGKSNLVKAIGFMRWFVLNSSSSTQVTDLIDVSKFRLSTETIDKPSFFEIVFLLEKKIYRYGFKLNRQRVIAEWLYCTPRTRESKLFDRKKQKFSVLNKFLEGKILDSKTRANALFLSVVAQFNGNTSRKILLWFQKLIIGSGIQGYLSPRYTVEMLKDKQLNNEIISLIKKYDLGISELKAKQVKLSSEHLPPEIIQEISREIFNNVEPNLELTTTEITTIHKQYDKDGKVSALKDFELDSNESEGTKKIFAFAAPIITSLKEGRVLIIDELDARLHPLITQSIIKLFNSNKSNCSNAQLIFMTHDTNLLNKKLFRPDQIWFVEKDRCEATNLYSLAEYKIAEDASFENDYIKGKYGAIPYIGNLKDLIV